MDLKSALALKDSSESDAHAAANQAASPTDKETKRKKTLAEVDNSTTKKVKSNSPSTSRHQTVKVFLKI